MLEFRLLGQFDIRLDSKPVEIPSRPAQSLLAYLLLAPRASHRREKLAGLLWPDSTDANARGYLRKALWQIRRSLPPTEDGNPELISADDISIAIDPDTNYWFDAEALQAVMPSSVSTDELIDAVSLYQGELLPGFYEDWVALERVRLRSEFEQKMNMLLFRLLQGEQWDRTIHWGERWIAQGEAPEPAYRALMIAHAGEGDMARLADTYERCVRALDEELGIQPSRQTDELYKELQQSDDVVALVERAIHIPRNDALQPSTKQEVETRMTNIELPLTSFIGRAEETQEIKRLISEYRLLTLTGPGGCGKTRLALNVGDSLVEEFADGVWLVELGTLADAELVPEQTANALKIPERTGQSTTDSLVGHLRDKHSLILIDNCEHLIEATATLIESLLKSCAQLNVLATSREALNIAGEIAWIVPSLALPDPDENESGDDLLSYDAVRLFIERAAGIRDFDMSESAVETVARICYRLDGIPLAVELAAARLKTLSIEQIANRLDDRFHLLTGGSRTAMPRHQTLRATMDWSYDLLPANEQAMFRQLAVFAGGWTLEGAEGITRPASDSFLPNSNEFTLSSSSALNLMTHLMEKSLVFREGEGEVVRYRMLETVREFGIVKVREVGEELAVRDRHLEMFMRLAEELEPLLQTDQLLWLDRLESELNNIRSAIDWSMENPDDPVASALRVQAGLRLMGSLGWFFERHSRGAPLSRLTKLLALSPADAPTSWRAKALNTSGFIRLTWGDYPGALQVLKEGLAIAREIQDTENVAWGLSRIGAVLTFQGHYTEASGYLEEGLELAIELGSEAKLIQAWCLNFLGDVRLSRKEYLEAQADYEESVAILRKLQNQSMLAFSARRLGLLALRRGELDEAQSLFEESLLLNQAVNHTQGMAASLAALAGLAVARGSLIRGAQLCGASEGILAATSASLYQSDLNEYERTAASVTARLDDPEISAAWSKGASMSLDECVAYGLAIEQMDGASIEGAQR